MTVTGAAKRALQVEGAKLWSAETSGQHNSCASARSPVLTFPDVEWELRSELR
jgi:hypothetical protein